MFEPSQIEREQLEYLSRRAYEDLVLVMERYVNKEPLTPRDVDDITYTIKEFEAE